MKETTINKGSGHRGVYRLYDDTGTVYVGVINYAGNAVPLEIERIQKSVPSTSEVNERIAYNERNGIATHIEFMDGYYIPGPELRARYASIREQYNTSRLMGDWGQATPEELREFERAMGTYAD